MSSKQGAQNKFVSNMDAEDLMLIAQSAGSKFEDSNKAALGAAVAVRQSEQALDSDSVSPSTMDYLAIAPAGTLVAYWNEDNLLRSAAIVGLKPKQRLAKLETKYGKQSVVGFEDIEWVRAGKRWPHQIWRLMKESVQRADKKEFIKKLISKLETKEK